MLRRALAGALAPEEAGLLWSAFDQAGDVVVVRIPPALRHRRALIGRALLEAVPPARAVFCQSSDVGGEHRTRGLELIAGSGGTGTEYREGGCRFAVDVGAAFFTPRLSTERMRVAGLVRDGERVLNMFGGAGLFSVLAARRSRCEVISVDVNPAAAALCERSAGMNRLAGTVESVLGDAREVIRGRGLEGWADRTIMPLPERAAEFAADAARATRPGGTIHYYDHVHSASRSGAAAEAEARCAAALPGSEALLSRVVRAVGPRYYQTVVDARA